MKSLVAALLGSIVAMTTEAQTQLTAEKLHELAQPYIDGEVVVGMTIGVLQGEDQLVLGYGQFSADDTRTPDGETIYEIGSVSKVFTGLLLADAVVQGRVSLVTPAEDLLPPGVKMNRRHESLPIRLWHLATHTSGLPRLPDNLLPSTDANDPYAAYSGKQLASFLASYKPRKRPGEEQAYSNLGVGLLGDLLAREQKTDYETLLQKRIAKPLGIASTSITLSSKQQERLAPPHMDGGAPGHAWNFERLAGCGAIRSTVDDLLQLARAHLDPPDGKLGQAIDLAWMIHQKPIEDSDFALGLGWHIAQDGQTRWHNGQTGGYHSMILISRPLKAAVVVIANTAAGEVDTLAQNVLRLLAGEKVSPRQPNKPQANTIDVSVEVMKKYVGKYQLAPGAMFDVSEKNGKLYVGLTGQSTFQVYPRTETEWFYTVVEATLTFHLNSRGVCDSVELFQNGVRQRAGRIE